MRPVKEIQRTAKNQTRSQDQNRDPCRSKLTRYNLTLPLHASHRPPSLPDLVVMTITMPNPDFQVCFYRTKLSSRLHKPIERKRMSVTSRMLILPRYQPSIECSATNLLVYEDCRLKPTASETLNTNSRTSSNDPRLSVFHIRQRQDLPCDDWTRDERIADFVSQSQQF